MKPSSRPVQPGQKSKKSPLPSSETTLTPDQPQAHPATGQSLSPIEEEALPAKKRTARKARRSRPGIIIAPSTEAGPDVRITR